MRMHYTFIGGDGLDCIVVKLSGPRVSRSSSESFFILIAMIPFSFLGRLQPFIKCDDHLILRKLSNFLTKGKEDQRS